MPRLSTVLQILGALLVSVACGMALDIWAAALAGGIFMLAFGALREAQEAFNPPEPEQEELN